MPVRDLEPFSHLEPVVFYTQCSITFVLKCSGVAHLFPRRLGRLERLGRVASLLLALRLLVPLLLPLVPLLLVTLLVPRALLLLDGV